MRQDFARGSSGLWVPHGFSFWEHRRTKKTLTLRTGERALRTVDDSGTVLHLETADRLDAVVRPRTVRVKICKIG